MSRAADLIKALRGVVKAPEIPTIRIIGGPGEPSLPKRLVEARNYINGRFENNIGIDASGHLHGAGLKHAHVYGRKGEEIVVVNIDGTGSHGTKGRIHPDDAEALIKRGFAIPPDRIIEWYEITDFQIELQTIFG